MLLLLLLLLATLLLTTRYCLLYVREYGVMLLAVYIFQSDLLLLAVCFGHSKRNIRRVKKCDIFARIYL